VLESGGKLPRFKFGRRADNFHKLHTHPRVIDWPHTKTSSQLPESVSCPLVSGDENFSVSERLRRDPADIAEKRQLGRRTSVAHGLGFCGERGEST